MKRTTLSLVLIRHTTETGEGRTITFYSLYMHLRDLDGTRQVCGPHLGKHPKDASPTVLAEWLAFPSDGLQTPRDLKVYRKDILGYAGACHGRPHLHFEIFMTESDFAAYFDAVQLGNENPVTPKTTDYWGHTYFVIPGGHKLQGTAVWPRHLSAAEGKKYFPELESWQVPEGSKLYVEVYFHKGQRYTQSWLETEGKVALLTPSPVPDKKDYEYDMYARATALYPSCPSDGYELLRFGRILSGGPTLNSANDMATWVAVPFDADKLGYVDVSVDGIQTLSDADFPFFKGWQKIADDNTLFCEDGLCDYDALRGIVGVDDDQPGPQERLGRVEELEAMVSGYVRGVSGVRGRENTAYRINKDCSICLRT